MTPRDRSRLTHAKRVEIEEARLASVREAVERERAAYDQMREVVVGQAKRFETALVKIAEGPGPFRPRQAGFDAGVWAADVARAALNEGLITGEK